MILVLLLIHEFLKIWLRNFIIFLGISEVAYVFQDEKFESEFLLKMVKSELLQAVFFFWGGSFGKS